MPSPKKCLGPGQEHLRAALPPDGELGPAMKALNERQQLFVLACLNMGSRVDHTRAVKIAGYQGTKNSYKVQAHRLAHDAKVQAAILEEAGKRIQAGTIAASGLLVEVIGAKKVPVKDKLKAAGMLLDRGGLPAASEHRVTVTHPEDRVAKLQRMANLAKSLGLDPRQLLGNLSDAIEGDYEVLVDAGVTSGAATSSAALPIPEPLQRDISAAGRDGHG